MNPTAQNHDQSRLIRLFFLFLISAPVFCLFLNVANLAIHKVNIPYWDDWREFITGEAGSFGLAYLFRPAADTMYPTGKFIDSLFVRFLDGNVVVYEVLTAVIVLGLMLWLQYMLLRQAVSSRLIWATAFFSTVLMLVPGTYWGRQFIAYHQALPLLIVLVLLKIALGKRRAWTDAILSLLTVIGGFAYISGAFASLALGLSLVLQGFFLSPGLRLRVTRAGLVVALASLLPIVAQTWVAVMVDQGPEPHWVFPYQPAFWMFILGKVARAFALPVEAPVFGLIATVGALLAGLVAATWLFRPIWQRKYHSDDAPQKDEILSVIWLGLAAAIGIYLVLVGVGRTQMTPDNQRNLLEVFKFGYLRFHFFWVTVMVPWLVVVVLSALEKLKGELVVRVLAPTLTLTILTLVWISGGLDHAGYYSANAKAQQEQLSCINRGVFAGQPTVRCQQAFPENLLPAYINTYGSELAFSRYFAPPDNLPFIASQRLLFPGPNANVKIEQATEKEGLLALATGESSRLNLTLTTQASRCRVIQVTVTQSGESASEIRVIWQRPGEDRGEISVVPTRPGEITRSLLLYSSSGFKRLLQIKPTSVSQRVEVLDVRVGCLRNI